MQQEHEPKFRKKQIVYYVGRHKRKIVMEVVDYFFNPKTNEFRYLLLTEEHPFTRMEKDESKLFNY